MALNFAVKITPNDKGNPPGKLADAELYFTDGVLDGLKLVGFAIWERRSGSGRNVTFPARQYSVNGERRSFALLRPVSDAAAQDAIRDRMLEAFAATGLLLGFASLYLVQGVVERSYGLLAGRVFAAGAISARIATPPSTRWRRPDSRSRQRRASSSRSACRCGCID